MRLLTRYSPTINILGTEIGVLNLEMAVELLSGWLKEDSIGRYMCVADVNCIMNSLRDRNVRRAYNNADVCVPDGMPLTWVGRFRGRSEIGRVYGPDLMLRMMDVSALHGYTNYFLGGAEGVAEDLKRRMETRFPGVTIAGTSCPPYRPLSDAEKQDLVAEINRISPDLLWVGLGAPKQDLFMAEFHEMLRCKVMIGVGAAFDFHTGRVPQAPRWMMRLGLEWVFRLLTEPRRLAPRYARNNPLFLWHIFLQQTGLKRYPTE